MNLHEIMLNELKAKRWGGCVSILQGEQEDSNDSLEESVSVT